MKKNLLIVILSILVISSIGYIIYEKTTNNNQQTPKEELTIDNKENEEKDSNQETVENSNIKDSQISIEKENYTEEDIIAYFEELDSELTNYNNEQSLSKTIKEKFVKCIDFIFYDEEIGGKTFKELTNSAKLKILEITMSIDSKINSKFPGYKESISSKYQDIKGKVVEIYLETTTNICNNDPELCKTAKEGFQSLKDNFGLTWDVIKDLVGSGTSKLKEWYEIWRYN